MKKPVNSIVPTLVKSVKEALLQETSTPSGNPIPCEIYIPYNHVQIEDDEPDTATLSATYIVHCPSEKKHTVYLKCKYDQKGRYVPGSMQYV